MSSSAQSAPWSCRWPKSTSVILGRRFPRLSIRILEAVPASPIVPLILILVLSASLILAFRSRRAFVGLLIALLAMFGWRRLRWRVAGLLSG